MDRSPSETRAMLERNERIGDLRDAVVEAALKWLHDSRARSTFALVDAIEALEKAEAGNG